VIGAVQGCPDDRVAKLGDTPVRRAALVDIRPDAGRRSFCCSPVCW